MDIEKIVDEVIKEVLRSMEELQKQTETKVEVLLLSDEKEKCYPHLGCCVTHNGSILEERIHTVILTDMTCDKIYKLANGCNDTPYLKLATQAIMTGKKVILVKEEVELYQYEKTAPKVYYDKIHGYLEFLKKCGISIVTWQDVPKYLEEHHENPIENQEIDIDPYYTIAKKLITDKDVKEALRSGKKNLQVMPKTIITQLAKDSIRAYNMTIIEKSEAI